MDRNEEVKIESYFQARQINEDYYNEGILPLYLRQELPSNKNAKILDIGCGLGQTLGQLRQAGYTELTGIDISNEAIRACEKKNLSVFKVIDITEFEPAVKYDFAIMSHVLEHLDKNMVIATLSHIKNSLLNANGKLIVMVPNAQSPSGTYWAFEDFTHNTLFTAGSLLYVLQSAGFKNVTFIDQDGFLEVKGVKKIIKKALLNIYIAKQRIRFIATGATFHRPSPVIYTWEIKVLAS